jgi:hypothetical protein
MNRMDFVGKLKHSHPIGGEEWGGGREMVRV